MAEAGFKWFDRKRTIFGLPLSFTKYAVTEEKLLIKTGFLIRRKRKSDYTELWMLHLIVL